MNIFNGSIVTLALLTVAIPAGLIVTFGLKPPGYDTSQPEVALVPTSAESSNSPGENQISQFSDLALANKDKAKLPDIFDSASATLRAGNYKQAPVNVGNASLNPDEYWNQGASAHMAKGDVSKYVEADELVTRSTYPLQEIGLDLDYTDGLKNSQTQVAIDIGADIYVETIH